MADFDISSLDSLPAAQFNPDTFSKTYLPVAQRISQQTGIDPNTLLGQMGLETGWGKSVIPGTNNLTNIKDFSGNGTSATDNQTGSTDKYRTYGSLDQYADDYASLLQRKYGSALNTGVDANATAKALKAGGYAEDPNYVSKLITASNMVAQARGQAPGAPQSSGGIISSANAATTGVDALPDLSSQLDSLPDANTSGGSGSGFLASVGNSLSNAASHPLDAAQSLAGGVGQGFGRVVLGSQRLLGEGLNAIGATDAGNWLQQDAIQGAKNLDQQAGALPNQGFAGAGKLVGNAAPAFAAGPGLLAQIAVNGGIGAADAAASGDTGTQQLTSGLVGGAAGGAGAMLAKGIGGLLGGTGGADVQALRQIGVAPTLGQSLGGVASKVEQRATSLPLIGDSIASGRQGAISDLNSGLVNDALSPIGQTLTKGTEAGSDAIAEAAGKLSAAYNQVLPQATFAADQPFMSAVQAARQNLTANGVPQQVLDRFDNIVGDQIVGRVGANGTMPGSVFKSAESNLGATAKSLSSGGDADLRTLGNSLTSVLSAARDSLARNSAPDVGAQLQAINQAYAKFKTVETAAGSTAGGQTNGLFTPAAYNRAVKSNVSQGMRARGQAFNQDLAGSAQNVLGASVPDSGTAGRIAQAGIGGGLAASAIANPLPALGYLGASGLAHFAYGPTGREAIARLLVDRPDLLRAIGGQVGNTSNITGGLLGSLYNSRQ